MTRIQRLKGRQRATFFKNDNEHLNKRSTKRLENYYRISKSERTKYKTHLDEEEQHIAAHLQIGSYSSI